MSESLFICDTAAFLWILRNFQEHLWATASLINIHDIDLSKNVMPVIDIMQMSAGNPFMEIDC